MFKKMVSPEVLGDLLNYTFLESLWPQESQNQCLGLHKSLYGSHLGFQNGRHQETSFGYIFAKTFPIYLIKGSKHMFLGLQILKIATPIV
jgi:hypothetical protein